VALAKTGSLMKIQSAENSTTTSSMGLSGAVKESCTNKWHFQ